MNALTQALIAVWVEAEELRTVEHIIDGHAQPPLHEALDAAAAELFEDPAAVEAMHAYRRSRQK